MANIFGKRDSSDPGGLANPKKPVDIIDPRLVFQYTYYFLVISFIFLLIFAFGEGTTWTDKLVLAGILSSVAFGSSATGAVIGFLFGIPHTATQPVVSAPAIGTHTNPPAASGPATGTGAASSGSATPVAQPNSTTSNMASSAPQGSSANTDRVIRDNSYSRSTNLEQIADWLTKIIVGVGLVEFRKIINQFNNLCFAVGDSLNCHVKCVNNGAIVGGLILAFLIAGFLIAYLWTYLYLLEIQKRMSEGEIIQESVNQSLASVNETIKDNDTRNKLAKDLAHTQLNLPPGEPDLPPGDLINAFKNAYQNVCSSIFFDAVNVLKQCSHTPGGKVRVSRTIPIFQALIAIDAKFEYPENYLQLGYAYMDKENPDYPKALENIDKAIQNFDRGGGRFMDDKLAHYRRALCRILLLQNAVPPNPGTEQDKNLILADLTVAGNDIPVDNNETKIINDWKQANQIS